MTTRDALHMLSVELAPAEGEFVSADLTRGTPRTTMVNLQGSSRMPLSWPSYGIARPNESIIWPVTNHPSEIVLEVSAPVVAATFQINGSVLRIAQAPPKPEFAEPTSLTVDMYDTHGVCPAISIANHVRVWRCRDCDAPMPPTKGGPRDEERLPVRCPMWKANP